MAEPNQGNVRGKSLLTNTEKFLCLPLEMQDEERERMRGVFWTSVDDDYESNPLEKPDQETK